MAKRSQGVRSSRTGPALHKKLRKLDSQIAHLDNAIQIAEYWRPKWADKQREKRRLLDQKRRYTRLLLKMRHI